MKVNAVILNYNDEATTAALVERIRNYQLLEEIIVVDNHSTDDSAEHLRRLAGGKVVLLETERNGGYGAGNNLGVRYAVEVNQATHVLIANPDVRFSERCIRTLCRMFAHHPEAGIVTATIQDRTYPDMKNAWPLRGFLRELLSAGPVCRRIFHPILEYPDRYFKDKKAIWVDVVHGSMLMVEAARFLECGGYDEDIFLYQEEAVLAQRMKALGCRSVLALNQSYIHEHSTSVGKTVENALDRQKLREESLLYYMKEYLEINRVQECVAKLFFAGIHLEIRLAHRFHLI